MNGHVPTLGTTPAVEPSENACNAPVDRFDAQPHAGGVVGGAVGRGTVDGVARCAVGALWRAWSRRGHRVSPRTGRMRGGDGRSGVRAGRSPRAGRAVPSSESGHRVRLRVGV